MPIGGKRSKRSEVNLGKHLEKKRYIVRIRNDDDLCMAQALVVAKAKLDNDPQYKYVADHQKPMQTRLARELHQNAGVPLRPCGIEQAKQFQAYLTEYQINIVSKEYEKKIIYAGPKKDKKIYLYMHNNHYDVITKMPGFFARNYYCHACKKVFSHLENHVCRNECKCCAFFPICPEESCDRVVIAVNSSRANDVTISTSNLEAAPSHLCAFNQVYEMRTTRSTV